jgi:hypothetical protein
MSSKTVKWQSAGWTLNYSKILKHWAYMQHCLRSPRCLRIFHFLQTGRCQLLETGCCSNTIPPSPTNPPSCLVQNLQIYAGSTLVAHSSFLLIRPSRGEETSIFPLLCLLVLRTFPKTRMWTMLRDLMLYRPAYRVWRRSLRIYGRII